MLELAPALRKLIPAYAGTVLHKHLKGANLHLDYYSFGLSEKGAKKSLTCTQYLNLVVNNTE